MRAAEEGGRQKRCMQISERKEKKNKQSVIKKKDKNTRKITGLESKKINKSESRTDILKEKKHSMDWIEEQK